MVKALLSKNARKKGLSGSSSPTESRSLPQTALTWFHSPPSTQIGVYKAIFTPSPPNDSYLDQLKELQRCDKPEGRKWALFMVAGGHFAGAVVRVGRPTHVDDGTEAGKAKKKPKKPLPDTEVLLHKTFHRYTSASSPLGNECISNSSQLVENRVDHKVSMTMRRGMLTALVPCFDATANRLCVM